MAYPGSLTANQQSALLAFMPLMRSNLLNFSKLVNNFILLNDVYVNGGVQAVNALLTNGDVVPDGTGLTGAQTLTKDDIITAMTAVQAFLTSYNTAAYEAFFVRAVGSANSAAV